VADEDEGGRRDRELIELLNELRVALPGVQVLFAFLLAVPFAQRFADVTDTQREAYTVALLCTLAGSVFLIAPTTFHRIRFRDRDKELLLRLGNRFTIVGMIFLAAAMTASVFLVTDVLYETAIAVLLSLLTAALFTVVWFLLPLGREVQDKS
jgi:Family of unknown function (DUF6328)